MAETGKPIEVIAMEALGKGFDITGDFRLKYAKGTRLVVLDETNKRDIVFPGAGFTIKAVSQDIRLDKGDRIRFKSDVLEFNQMSELLNQKSSIQGKVPSGYLNSIYDLTGDWLHDAADTKNLAFDGYFISLYHLHLTASPLILNDRVKKSVPPHWDPAALARFIQTFGTHVIVGMAIGGQDLICVRQNNSSTIPTSDLRGYLEDLGDVMFSDGNSPSLLQRKSRDGKQKVPDVFNRILQSNSMQLASVAETSSKDGLTIICSKRGGNVFLHSHSNWLQTVPTKPEGILFKFVPITSLLTGIPGSGYLSHAINLYLRYKPVPEDLRYFLEFQVPQQWAPMFSGLPLRHQTKKASCPSLQFAFMGPKMHVNSTQVSSDLKPVVGLRLYLEGKKCNRLALHIQHLSSLPSLMSFTSGKPSQWRGSDDYMSNDQFLEPVRWKRYSHVCTSVVKHDPNWLQEVSGGVFIVTGAQLLSKGKWPKTVLHLRLHYTHIPHCTIRRTEWGAAPETFRKGSFLTNLSMTFSFTSATNGQQKQAPTALNSGVYPDGPPEPIRSKKLLKYVDVSEVVRGPHNAPGHWLVTAAKLVNESGKISLQVKFALLDYP
ncbi:MAC/Perforin domain-containing protein isoform 2 [Hibiscus syriacus]|uniref:MAC/Perforin domain-containing protein isoform 2 n=1 Tax=Hibiscus syriacus TaxID=106335 RepID=A0A6A3AGQ0_HIBSY|nr:MACPF domain-containing protein At1g14780-like [Hibiscus syriacus]KAE8702973.1 MAC/Perforin domain-containing protein isoform 2 [Hibiscus syriacus]